MLLFRWEGVFLLTFAVVFAYALWEEAAACADAPQPSSHLR
jgi:hypothetical protein